MKFVLLCVLALTCSVLGQRNPNPCEGVTDREQFRNDWSTCADYFFCDYERAVPSGPCPDGYGFTREAVACSVLANDCAECPEEGNFAVAAPDDLECMSYLFCISGKRTENRVTCSEGLRFNRVTGVCDFRANVPCRRSDITTPPPSRCPPGESGDQNSDENCSSFIQCSDGKESGPYSCGPDLHYNPTTNACDKPENLDPPCEDAGLPVLPEPSYVPEAPILRPEESHQSFRERLMTKLHLNH